jgi:hypothetical protein
MTALFCRATFENMKPAGNKMGVRVPGRVEIEVFRFKGDTWKARTLPTRGEHDVSGQWPQVMEQMQARFETQVTPWKWVDKWGDEQPAPDYDERVFHLIGPDHMQAGLKESVRRSMCGKTVMAGRVLPGVEAVTCNPCLASAKR